MATISNVVENTLGCAAPEVTFIKCPFFMENWSSALESMGSEDLFLTVPTDLPLDHKMPMVWNTLYQLYIMSTVYLPVLLNSGFHN